MDAPRICNVTFISIGDINVVTEFARECALSELLYAADPFLMSETIQGLWDMFLR